MLRDEVRRQATGLELIASENFVSEAVLEAMGSVFTNKYAEGYPGKRYYGGCENVDRVEHLAIERAKELFGAEHANVQSHSGTQANISVYMTVLEARRHRARHESRSRRPPDTRPSAEFFRQAPTSSSLTASRKTTETIDYDEIAASPASISPK